MSEPQFPEFEGAPSPLLNEFRARESLLWDLAAIELNRLGTIQGARGTEGVRNLLATLSPLDPGRARHGLQPERFQHRLIEEMKALFRSGAALRIEAVAQIQLIDPTWFHIDENLKTVVATIIEQRRQLPTVELIDLLYAAKLIDPTWLPARESEKMLADLSVNWQQTDPELGTRVPSVVIDLARIEVLWPGFGYMLMKRYHFEEQILEDLRAFTSSPEQRHVDAERFVLEMGSLGVLLAGGLKRSADGRWVLAREL